MCIRDSSLPFSRPAEKVAISKSTLQVDDAETKIVISTDNKRIAFDKTTGYLNSLVADELQVLHEPLKHNFWRPQTDNDRLGWKTLENKKVWFDATQHLALSSFEYSQTDTGVTVKTRHTNGSSIKVATQYHIDATANVTVNVTLDADADLPSLLRVGMSTAVSGELERMAYYGKGPHENYIDRNQSAETDVYQGLVSDFIHSYARPQENGNRTGVKWLTLSDYAQHSFSVKAYKILVCQFGLGQPRTYKKLIIHTNWSSAVFTPSTLTLLKPVLAVSTRGATKQPRLKSTNCHLASINTNSP